MVRPNLTCLFPAPEAQCPAMRFRVNDLVHNKMSNDDGRVIEVKPDGYIVAIPESQGSWMLGAHESFWQEAEVEPSNNSLLR